MDVRKALLDLLRQGGRPLSVGEVQQRLGVEVSSRTVRRWLQELVEQGLVQREGHTRGVKYVAVVGHDGCFGEASQKVLESVARPLFEREPVTYREEWLGEYMPNSTAYLPAHVKEKLHEAGRRTQDHDPAGTYAHKIFNRLLIDLSYNSSRLEGNTFSLLDTERLLLHGDSPVGKLDAEKSMILNHKEAIRYLVDNAPRLEVSGETICTLHYLLAEGLVEPKYAGKVRDFGVRIGGSTYIPYEDPRRLEGQLAKIVEKGADIQDPYEQSLFLLVHISYLQAFMDVNKRTARLAANIPLIKYNFVPCSFIDVPRDAYMSAIIAVYELQDVRPLVDLYTYSYLRTCKAYDETVRSLGFDEIRIRYRAERRALIAKIILQKLRGEKLKAFIQSEASDIPTPARERFIEDVWQDLELINPARIAGLGITVDDLNAWVDSGK